MNDLQQNLRDRGLVRPRRGRLLAGVCAGLARRFGVAPWQARVLFLVSMLLPGPQFLIYLVLWVLMPNETTDFVPYQPAPQSSTPIQPTTQF